MVLQKNYRVGIDVGLRSTGFAAIEVDENGAPLELLNILTFIHDAGVDPEEQKTAKTRRLTAGVARRMRRLIRRRRQRLAQLDEFITSQGWPIIEHEEDSDPYLPWRVRAELSEEKIDDPEELAEMLSIAVRHMARHRGWRNPYARVESLLAAQEPSEKLDGMRERAENLLGYELDPYSTPAQLVAAVGYTPERRLRQSSKKEGLLGGKLMQSDNVLEIRNWFEMQSLPEDLLKALVLEVFRAESPMGSAAERVGKDALPGQGSKDRALRASLVFQEFRIISILTNLRIREDGNDRPLTAEELQLANDFLMKQTDDEYLGWGDVAKELGINRNQLRGTAKETSDGERASARPPIMVTNKRMNETKIKPIKVWWQSASPEEQELLIELLSNALSPEKLETDPNGPAVAELIDSLSEDDLLLLEGLKLPDGRVAYSKDSLRRLTKRMLSESIDLTYARQAEFGVSNDWRPPADPIGKPVGNASVDRVAKQVARWLSAIRSEYGDPKSIQIEHVREGLSSEKVARERDREMQKRFEANRKMQREIADELGLSGDVRGADVVRYQAIQRQHSQCLYCGEMITFRNTEMDHILPRAGAGSTNARVNLAAVCITCNRQKGNTPFAIWAENTSREGVNVIEAIRRVRNFDRDPGSSPKDFKRFQNEVIQRLERKEYDSEVDARSMESVAWMARELHHRIQSEFPNTTVNVFRGELTAEARRTTVQENGRITKDGRPADLEFQYALPFIGGAGKTRLDRRHHAVDAAVVALMRPQVAKTLKERIDIRNAQRYTRSENNAWKTHLGSSPQIMLDWQEDMVVLCELLAAAMQADRIPVVNNVRLRLGNGSAHMDTVTSFTPKGAKHWRVGDEISLEVIDRASTPALWCALTRHPDFDPENGLPASDSREIRVNHQKLGPTDEIQFFGSNAAFLAVRGGYAAIGNTIHHARVYRINGKKPVYAMVRVFATDLARHRGDDLFTVNLPLQSISMRTAEPKIRKALADGTAEYLGWLVVGDELKLDMSQMTKGDIGELLNALPEISRWTLTGFYSESKLRLRPRLVAAEGLANLPEDSHLREKSISTILEGPGWRPAVNVVFGSCNPVVIRRDTLGQPRLESQAHLPTSWTI